MTIELVITSQGFCTDAVSSKIDQTLVLECYHILCLSSDLQLEMPLLHRSKRDKAPLANLTGELPPSPPTSEAPSSINSGGADSNTRGGLGNNNQTVTTTTTTTTTTVAGGTHTQSEPKFNDNTIGSNDSGYQGLRSSGYPGQEPRSGGYDAPNVPRRNEMREYQQNNAAGFAPSSPNYSRPMGATESLKAAAHGIHVGPVPPSMTSDSSDDMSCAFWNSAPC